MVAVLCGLVLFGFTKAECSTIKLSQGHNNEALLIDEKDLMNEATAFVVKSINNVIASNIESGAAYLKYFGVEPEKPTMEFFKVVRRTFENSKPTLKMNKWVPPWLVAQSGPYTQFGVRILIEGSEFKTGILFIRLERTPMEGKPDEVAISPVSLFVSLFK